MISPALRQTLRRTFHTSLPSFNANAPTSGPSALEQALREGLKASMKSKDRAAATCFKAILADVSYAAKSGANPHEPSTQESVMNVLRKGISQRLQAAESYAPTSPSPHAENHSSLLSEISLLRSYLPQTPSDESVQNTIKQIIGSLSQETRETKGVVGSVMKALWEQLGEAGGGVDKKSVGKWVQEALKRS